MFKRIVGLIVVLVLFVGSICGLVYGIKYHKEENQQTQTIAQQQDKIETLEKQLKQLMEEKQKIIADNMISIEEKNAKIAELEAKIAKLGGSATDTPSDEFTLCLYLSDADETGYISFSTDSITLTNTNRSATFTYNIDNRYKLDDVMHVVSSVRVEYYEGAGCIWLLKDLTESDTYAVNFYVAEASK